MLAMFWRRPRIWVTWPEARAVDRGAAQRVAGLGAAAEQGLGVDRLDRAVDLDVVIIGLERQPRQEARPPDRAEAPAFAGLRVEIVVAAGDHRQLRR